MKTVPFLLALLPLVSCTDLGADLVVDRVVLLWFYSGFDGDSLTVKIDGQTSWSGRGYSNQPNSTGGLNLRLACGPHQITITFAGNPTINQYNFYLPRVDRFDVYANLDRSSGVIRFDSQETNYPASSLYDNRLTSRSTCARRFAGSS